MSDFTENLKFIKNEFQKTKANSNKYFYGLLALAGILLYLGVTTEGTALKIGASAGAISLVIIVSQVSTDIKYLEKRIENIESELVNINEKIEELNS